MERDAIRIGNAERAEAHRLLQEQASLGRLDDAELASRRDQVGEALTRADLLPIFADLPVDVPQVDDGGFAPYGPATHVGSDFGSNSPNSFRDNRYQINGDDPSLTAHQAPNPYSGQNAQNPYQADNPYGLSAGHLEPFGDAAAIEAAKAKEHKEKKHKEEKHKEKKGDEWGWAMGIGLFVVAMVLTRGQTWWLFPLCFFAIPYLMNRFRP